MSHSLRTGRKTERDAHKTHTTHTTLRLWEVFPGALFAVLLYIVTAKQSESSPVVTLELVREVQK